MDPLEDFTKTAGSLLNTVLKARGIDIEPIFDEAPGGMGDLAFPCFPLAKTLRKAPKLIAEELAADCRDQIRIGNGPWQGITSAEASDKVAEQRIEEIGHLHRS